MSKKQVVVIILAISLIVLLLFGDTKLRKTVSEKPVEEAVSEVNMDQLAKWANDSIDAASKAKIKSLMDGFNHATTEQKLMLYDSLTHLWDELRKPSIAAYYAEQRLKAAPPIDSQLIKVGVRYLGAARFSKPQFRGLLYKKAIEYLEKANASDTTNLTVKTNLGISYVEGTDQPMKGIGLLLAVVSKDSINFDAQLNLGLFAVKSGQYDKAIKRFEKVLRIKPDYIETYLFLADAYERMGDKLKTIETLEKYVNLVDDITVKDQVKEYIKSLKNS